MGLQACSQCVRMVIVVGTACQIACRLCQTNCRFSVVKLDGPFAGSYDWSARVTSDSQTVVYLRRSQPDAGPKLYKVPIGGGTPVVLFTPPPVLFNAYF